MCKCFDYKCTCTSEEGWEDIHVQDIICLFTRFWYNAHLCKNRTFFYSFASKGAAYVHVVWYSHLWCHDATQGLTYRCEPGFSINYNMNVWNVYFLAKLHVHCTCPHYLYMNLCYNHSMVLSNFGHSLPHLKLLHLPQYCKLLWNLSFPRNKRLLPLLPPPLSPVPLLPLPPPPRQVCVCMCVRACVCAWWLSQFTILFMCWDSNQVVLVIYDTCRPRESCAPPIVANNYIHSLLTTLYLFVVEWYNYCFLRI